MSAFELGEDGIYRCSGFAEFTWQRHGFGTSKAQPPVDVTLRQVHSNVVRNAHGLRDREAEGDALVTVEAGRAIGVRTADCVPILLLDGNRRAVAAVHAGWRGSAAQIVVHALQTLRGEFDSEPKDIRAAIGPCIRQCCYEVGSEVVGQFSENFVVKSRGQHKGHLDLAAANRKQLIENGVPASSIFDIDACTVCQSSDFFSYRREPENPGRMISSIQRLA